jgi:hypothetical protein
MKSLCKSLFTLALASTAFLIGFYLGQEKIVARFPDFQEDQEEKA